MRLGILLLKVFYDDLVIAVDVLHVKFTKVHALRRSPLRHEVVQLYKPSSFIVLLCGARKSEINKSPN